MLTRTVYFAGRTARAYDAGALGTRLFHLATVCVALLLPATAFADDKPWTSEPLSVDALEKAREELKPKLEAPPKDADKSVGAMLKEAASDAKVAGFIRYKLGEVSGS